MLNPEEFEKQEAYIQVKAYIELLDENKSLKKRIEELEDILNSLLNTSRF